MKKLILVLVSFLAMLICSTSAFGCSCAMPTAAEAFKKSKAVFTGTVVAIESDGVTFRVNRSWKDSATTEIKVYVQHLGTSCDPGVAVGKTLLVYALASGTRLPLLARYCFRTHVLEVDDSDAKELDKLASSNQARKPTVAGHERR